MSPAPGPMRRWLDEHVPLDDAALQALLGEPVPARLGSFWWALGGTVLVLFAIQAVTGTLLALHYVPTAAGAWDSVQAITGTLPFGWWLRSLHHWSAQGMVVAAALHLARVFVTGAYRRPREPTWVLGVGLLLLTLVLGFTGYSLVFEQRAFWGATVAARLVGEVPLVGAWAADLLHDGAGAIAPGRLFVLHAGILPALLAVLLLAHLVLVRLHGVAPLDDDEGPRVPWYPDHVLTELALACGLFVLLCVLSVVWPATLGERADPARTPLHVRPEWYFYAVFRWFKLAPMRAGLLGLAGGVTVLLAWPWIDASLRRRAPRREVSLALGALAVLVWVVFTVWEAMA